MEWQYDDGGRAAAGYKGDCRDCVVRAIAIATGVPYQEVYDELNTMAGAERTGKKKRSKSSSRNGVYKRTYKKYLEEKLGWTWHACMGIGTGCKVHLREGEVPMNGAIIVRLSGHLSAVVDGVVRDKFDPSRNGWRCVYGYWRKDNHA